MKIAFLNIYSGLVNRGAESVVQELALRLSKRYEVAVFQGGVTHPSRQSRGALLIEGITHPLELVTVPGVKILSPEPPSGMLGKWQRRWYQDAYNRQVAWFTDQCLPYLIKGKFDVVFPTNGVAQMKVLRQSKVPSKLVYINHGQFHPNVLRLAGWDTWMALRCMPEVFVALTEPVYRWAKRWASKSLFEKYYNFVISKPVRQLTERTRDLFRFWISRGEYALRNDYDTTFQSSSMKTQVVKIPHGIDLKKFHPQVKPAKLPVPSPVVLCVAGLQKYKRVELLIRAVGELNERKEGATSPLPSPIRRGGSFSLQEKSSTLRLRPEGVRMRSKPVQRVNQVSLLILGDGPLKTELEELGNRLIGLKNFKIMSVSYEDMPHYYSACDLFSLPSQSLEAFGVSYLEAMACNKPVVAPDDEARRELIADAGVLTNMKDVIKYAEALNKTFLVNWKSKPRQQAEQYDWNLVIEKYERLLEQL